MNQFNENNQKHGTWTYYYTNSKHILSIANYVNGAYHGEYSCYNPNGTLAYTGYFNNDENIGLWKTFEGDKETTNTFFII